MIDTAAAPSAMSPNLALNESVRERRQRGLSTLHLGFGEARLPLLDDIETIYTRAARAGTNYPPVAGSHPARLAAAHWFSRRALPTSDEQIVFGPGSKPLLFATFVALDADVYLPQPCWNSYAPQVRLAGRTPLPVAVGRSGGLPSPSSIRDRLQRDRQAGLRPRLVVVTTPDNPTGSIAKRDEVEQLCTLAVEEELIIISDEIYRDLVHPGHTVISPAERLPASTVVLSGLSKSLALGGWRIGFARFPDTALGAAIRDRVVSVASDVWSAMPAPMHEVAAYVLSEPETVTVRLAQSRRLHADLAAQTWSICQQFGGSARRPEGAFYVYVDLERHRDSLRRRGITDSLSLAEALLDETGVAVLAGEHLGDDPERLRFKIATTGFIGDTVAEQRAALAAVTASRLPHVAARLLWFQRALEAIVNPATRRVNVDTQAETSGLKDIIVGAVADRLHTSKERIAAAADLRSLRGYTSFAAMDIVDAVETALDREAPTARLTADRLGSISGLTEIFDEAAVA